MSHHTTAGELPALLKPSDLASVTGHAVATLRNWRSLGTGPSFIKAGGKVLYPRADVLRWLAGAAA
ncbi:helix-turn-helix transcriptional regulator [Xylanimonas sp. McL0601]|uniref:helix-turn-helix transcriptional regulator n=1 Tax=Xylanimonas sp. McL0601 TaxID=3414739 RepID=UPI003CF887FA